MWLGYLGLFVILVISIQLIIGGLVNYDVLSITKSINFYSYNDRFCIIGSGVAGSTIAHLLSKIFGAYT